MTVRLSEGIVNHPVLVLVATLLVTAFAIAQMVDLRTGAPRLLLDPSTDSMLSPGNPEYVFFERMKEVFGRSDTLLVALATDDVFTSERLQQIADMTERIEDLDEVHHVSSLSTALNIRSENDDLLIEPFYDEPPTDIPGLAHSSPIVSGELVFLTTAVSSDPSPTLKVGLYGSGDSPEEKAVWTRSPTR